MRNFAVYILKIEPTAQCNHTNPFEYYVGSTYVDENHGVEDRIQDHRNGRNSNVVRRGYAIISGEQVGGLYTTREDAEHAERATAENMRRTGQRVWQN